MVRKWTTVLVRKELKDKLQEVYEKKKVELFKRGVPNYTSYVNSLLWQVIEAEENLMKYSPYLSFVGFNRRGNGVFIYDYKMDRIAEVTLHNGELYCDLDDSTRCIHVGFAYALPEIYSVMKNLGYRNPRMI